MTVNTLKCNICGAPIGEKHAPWMNEYRAVYTSGHEWWLAQLSGVGIKDPDDQFSPLSTVPVDPTEKSPSPFSPPRSPSDQQDLPEEIAIMTMLPFLETGDIDGFPGSLDEKDSSAPQVSPWGFLFHESCWKLFTEVCNPEKISLAVLMGVCMSFPASGWVIDWGHDYGGIYKVTPERQPEAGRDLGELDYVYAREVGSRPELFHLYPLGFANPKPILEEKVGLREEDDRETCPSKVSPVYRFGPQSDSFTGLPAELREMILCHLSTRDVLNFLLSSRIFASYPLPRKFWVSRFRPDSELVSILELDFLRTSPPFLNWKAIFKILWRYSKPDPRYRCTSRERIWDLLRPLADAVIRLSDNSTVYGTARKTFFHPDLSEDGLRWRRLGGLVESKEWFKRGCQVMFVRTVRIPDVVVGIYVSRICIGGTGFVTGLRFIDGGGRSTKLGYVLPGRELYLRNSKGKVGTETCGLRGLYLAVGMKGIKALAVAMGSSDVLDWTGDPENIPRGRLIPRNGGIRDLKGEFDGIKLISLSIPGEERPLYPEDSPVRDQFAWFPDIPPENLCLNEKQFSGVPSGRVSRGVPRHRQVCWMHFGGPGGVYLLNVVSISCYFYKSDWNIGIEVRYDREVEGSTTRMLGSRTIGPPGSESIGKITFDVDGPGGEYISAVAVDRVHALVKVRTNRGRLMLFVQELSPGAVKYSPPPVVEYGGAAVTGFYAEIDPWLKRVGVVTEYLASLN